MTSKAGCRLMIAVLALAPGCSRQGEQRVPRAVLQVQQLILPTGARMRQVFAPEWAGQSVRVVWEFEVGQGWAAYTRWARGRLGDRFRLLKEDEWMVMFRQELSGDTIWLTIEVISRSSPLELRTTYVASAS